MTRVDTASATDNSSVPTPRVVPDRFEDFFRAEWESIYRPLVATIGDAELARDATAEAMARAYQRWSKVRTYANPCGWVYRVGLNWARSRYRKQSREILRSQPAASGRSNEGDFRDGDIEKVLRRLPLDQRAVVVLRYYLDWTHDQIGIALGIPVGTVKSRLHRALKKLEQEVQQ